MTFDNEAGILEHYTIKLPLAHLLYAN